MCATRISSALLMLTMAVCPYAMCAAQSPTCTIVGDVGAPDTYTFSQGESVDLVRLLAKAGASAEKGSAVVVRGPSMQILSTSTNQHTPTPLQHGDIVVFRRLDQQFAGNLNAVAVVDGTPRIVPLVGGTPALRELLASVNLEGGQSVVAFGVTGRLPTEERSPKATPFSMAMCLY